MYGEIISLPSLFYSDLTSAPIEHCIQCDKYLLKEDVAYFIEKAIKNYPSHQTTDTLFEYAICVNCMMNMRASISEESAQRIESYFLSGNYFFQRQQHLLKQPFDLDVWLDKCIMKETPLHKTDTYQIMCECAGDQLIVTDFPYGVSEAAMEEVQTLLSKKTKDELGGFKQKFLNVPPEVEDILKDRPLLVL